MTSKPRIQCDYETLVSISLLRSKFFNVSFSSLSLSPSFHHYLKKGISTPSYRQGWSQGKNPLLKSHYDECHQAWGGGGGGWGAYVKLHRDHPAMSYSEHGKPITS